MNVTSLTAGVQYTFTIIAVAGDNETVGEAKTVSQYTKPDVVRNLTVSEITTSSVSLIWAEPEGNSSFYRVQWTGGEINVLENVTQTSKIITNLTAGVQYTITVTAVADDGHIEGQSTIVSQYTKPDIVRNLTITAFTTSSMSLSWTKPEGNSSTYKVQWTGGNISDSCSVNVTSKTISNLAAGVNYTITVTAVAGDGHTEGQRATVSRYTKPGIILGVAASTNTIAISLKWKVAAGEILQYRVQWHN
ncbi:receptor-type tyrosine-protein phosphatase eta-like, partial [Scomber japonicus]|uniref:receptor-type tyrosine-protein phosphatase eta-like n=1 Tax=Scomber japonicus TaxID=13676 RepID=UPI002306935F